MNTFFYNIVSDSTVLDRKALFEDFRVIKLLIKDDNFRFKTISIPMPKKVAVTYYRTWKEIYLLVDKDYNDKPLRKLFADNGQILIRDETNFDDDTFLNIVLQYEIKKRNEIEGINDAITNQAYYYIVESNNHDKCYITLKFRFDKKKLFPHVFTFTQYGKLTPQEKSKNKGPFFKPGPYAMQQVNENDYENKEELFVIRHSKNLKGKEKNTVSMFETSHFDETKQSKIYYLLKIFDILQHSKYLKNFNFASDKAQEYKVTEVCKTVESLFAQWIQNTVINVVYASRELTKDELSVLTDNKNCQCTQSRDIVPSACNLVFLNSTTRSAPPSEDDIFRDKNLQSGEVVQHVNINLLGNAPALEAALRNLMIKSEIKARAIISFPANVIQGNKTYSFFVVKKTNDDEEDEPLRTYHKLTINEKLEIVDIQLFMEEDIFPYTEFISDEYIGAIEDSEGNAISLKDSDRVLLPDCLNLANYIFDMEERLGKTITGHDLCTIVQRVIDNENKKAKKEEFEDAFANVCGQNSGLHYNSDKEFLVSEIQKMFPRTLGQRVRAMLNVFYRPKEANVVETYYPQFKNIYFNEKEYMVAPESSVQKSMTSFVRIKDIATIRGENFFEELIPMMASTVVRNKQLTIAPFPFKYLKEAIENPSLTK